jgi:hypothetical protein
LTFLKNLKQHVEDKSFLSLTSHATSYIPVFLRDKPNGFRTYLYALKILFKIAYSVESVSMVTRCTFTPLMVKLMKARRMRRAGHVERMGEKRNAYSLLVGKPEGRRPLGRPRRRWVDNIRMDLVELGWGYVDWTGLPQDRDRWRALLNAVLNRWVP